MTEGSLAPFGRWRHARNLAMFIAIPVTSAFASLIAIPAVTGVFGAAGWSAMAIGLSVGAAASVVGELGWGLNGPARAARANSRARSTLFSVSLATKAILLAPVVAAAAGVTWMLVPEYRVEAVLMSVASGSLGLSMSWYFVGTGRPLWILLTDPVPRLTASLAAAIALAAGAPLALYPALLLAAALLSPAIGAALARASPRAVTRFGFRRLLLIVRAQGTALRGRAASALYIALPTALISVVDPSAVPVFSAAERLQRMFLTLLQSVPNSMLTWASRPGSALERRIRISRAVLVNAVLGVVAGASFAWSAPAVSAVLFSGAASVPPPLAGACGLVIALTCASRGTGSIALVAMGKVPVVSNSAVLAALVGIPGILVLGSMLGALGGVLGEVLAESVALTYQVMTLARMLRAR